MVVKTVPRPPKFARKFKYNEPKKRFQVLITESAMKKVDALADKLGGITRSEAIEILIRAADIEEIEVSDD